MDNPTSIIRYTYGNGLNRDQLISFNGQSFTYDNLGNPTIYKGTNLTWAKCRQLMAYGNIASYTYNVKGIKTQKVVGNVTSDYYLDGTKIIAQVNTDMTDPNNPDITTIEYIYGANGVTGLWLVHNRYYNSLLFNFKL